MNRRGFFGLLAGAIAGATLDPERLLWVPGRKLISIPAANAIVTPEWIARETLSVLRQSLIEGKRQLNAYYSSMAEQITLQPFCLRHVRRPARFHS